MSSRGSPSKVVSGCMGLAGFALAIIAGEAVGNPAADTLSRAVAALIVCQACGFLLGWVAEGAINRRLAELSANGAGTINPAAERVTLSTNNSVPATRPASPPVAA